MIEFFNIHKQDFIHAVIIMVIVVILTFLTNKLHHWLIKEKQRKFTGVRPKPFNALRIILNTLWLILGLISVSYLFVDTESQTGVKNDFKIALYIGLVLTITVILATSVNMWFRHDIKKKLRRSHDPTSFKFLRYIVLALIYFIGAILCLLAFPSLKGVAQTALGGAGVLALIAGLAAQEALSNVIGGIFIISFKPFKIGDLIKVTDTMVGRVSDITLRHTVIRNFENKMIVIPNSVINKEKLINYDMGQLKCCERIEIGISHDSDIDLAKKIMQEECEKHPLIYDNRTPSEKSERKPIVRTALTELNDSSMTIRAWCWGKNYDHTFNLKCDVLESIKKRFDKEGVVIPFPSRTVYIKKEKENDQ